MQHVNCLLNLFHRFSPSKSVFELFRCCPSTERIFWGSVKRTITKMRGSLWTILWWDLKYLSDTFISKRLSINPQWFYLRLTIINKNYSKNINNIVFFNNYIHNEAPIIKKKAINNSSERPEREAYPERDNWNGGRWRLVLGVEEEIQSRFGRRVFLEVKIKKKKRVRKIFFI